MKSMRSYGRKWESEESGTGEDIRQSRLTKISLHWKSRTSCWRKWSPFLPCTKVPEWIDMWWWDWNIADFSDISWKYASVVDMEEYRQVEVDWGIAKWKKNKTGLHPWVLICNHVCDSTSTYMLLSELSSLFTPSLHVGDEVVVQATPLPDACPDIFINSMIRESTCGCHGDVLLLDAPCPTYMLLRELSSLS